MYLDVQNHYCPTQKSKFKKRNFDSGAQTDTLRISQPSSAVKTFKLCRNACNLLSTLTTIFDTSIIMPKKWILLKSIELLIKPSGMIYVKPRCRDIEVLNCQRTRETPRQSITLPQSRKGNITFHKNLKRFY